MKKLILLTALAAPLAQANTTDETCDMMAKVAQSMMKHRQNGIPLEQLLGTLKDTKFEDMFKPIALKAYEHRRYTVELSQEREITTFRNKIYASCRQGS